MLIFYPWHFLYFIPDPQKQGSFLPGFLSLLTIGDKFNLLFGFGMKSVSMLYSCITDCTNRRSPFERGLSNRQNTTSSERPSESLLSVAMTMSFFYLWVFIFSC